ncbi:MAG: AbrB/MazE/SpoVT family DNA-binding domain-containing protein [Leptospiraceae bacterium]|nr:AbrB/MazE/SpoVT family DNA-binding domain-containing protein [Leptospiraceae bacterium]
MNKAKVFKNGDSQAVRLPKEYRFQGKEVYIKKEGNNVILSPLDDIVDSFWISLQKFEPNTEIQRNQPSNIDDRSEI